MNDSKWLEVQDVVERFKHIMLAKLAKNRHKGDAENWRKDKVQDLMDRLWEEVYELELALMDGSPPEEVEKEAADVANFCLMIADKVKYK